MLATVQAGNSWQPLANVQERKDEAEAEGWQRRVLLTNSTSSCVCLLRRDKNLLRAERPPSLGCVS